MLATASGLSRSRWVTLVKITETPPWVVSLGTMSSYHGHLQAPLVFMLPTIRRWPQRILKPMFFHNCQTSVSAECHLVLSRFPSLVVRPLCTCSSGSCEYRRPAVLSAHWPNRSSRALPGTQITLQIMHRVFHGSDLTFGEFQGITHFKTGVQNLVGLMTDTKIILNFHLRSSLILILCTQLQIHLWHELI